MGQEISLSSFDRADFERFSQRLEEETRLLAGLCAASRLSEDGFVAGFEIEAWLLDHGFFPNPINQQFLAKLAHPLVVPELSRFNVELNCDPLPLSGDVLRRAETALTGLWRHCNAVAHGFDANMVMIGTLPVIRDEDLTLANLSPLERYRALNAEILRQREGRPLVVDIAGEDHLRSEHRDVMLEAAATSFQIHLKTPAALASRYYNASVVASAPLLAACVNAPFLFGRRLWQETRIPLFEQAVSICPPGAEICPAGRVGFGRHYLRQSLAELFLENLKDHPVLMPELSEEPPANLFHLRLHNGTIWRWNRPLIGFDDDSTPHLRIEHRVVPAGPSVLDTIANAALFYGLVQSLATDAQPPESRLPFDRAYANFYAAARDGLRARLVWLDGRESTARDLLQQELLPVARRGLESLGIAAEDIDFLSGRHQCARPERAQRRRMATPLRGKVRRRHACADAGLCRAPAQRLAGA